MKGLRPSLCILVKSKPFPRSSGAGYSNMYMSSGMVTAEKSVDTNTQREA